MTKIDSILRKPYSSEIEKLIILFAAKTVKLELYKESLKQSYTISEAAKAKFELGGINYFDFLKSLEAAFQMQCDYYSSLSEYNETGISLQYIIPEN